MTDTAPADVSPAPVTRAALRSPPVGLVVYFHHPQDDGSLLPRPALVVEAYSDSEVGLSVHTPDGVFFVRCVLASDGPSAGAWSWPSVAPR